MRALCHDKCVVSVLFLVIFIIFPFNNVHTANLVIKLSILLLYMSAISSFKTEYMSSVPQPSQFKEILKYNMIWLALYHFLDSLYLFRSSWVIWYRSIHTLIIIYFTWRKSLLSHFFWLERSTIKVLSKIKFFIFMVFIFHYHYQTLIFIFDYLYFLLILSFETWRYFPH